MTASQQIKGLLAGVATFALIGTAIAQGTPPDPTRSAPVGAGQQSSQQTPMGTTGVQADTGASTDSGASNSTSNMGASGSTSGSTMGAPGSSTETGSAMGSTVERPARADRN